MCGFCQTGIEKGQESVMIQSTDCFHTVHAACFKQRAIEALSEGNEMVCPECIKPITA